ncbi:hypothetical protein K5I29_01530 [Flavobacterium agricola]|uniref:DUF4374 domain-containing protein n=1 Tax=Flavobacterium agricola TaxID=2870839 RepID=A0ABY6M2T6_9FLAO|nr:hypothetical protein [Flavobacterium agricola]UYW01633.1 hypothetical protein K5I29_01530 [Flavobacterium agricola]
MKNKQFKSFLLSALVGVFIVGCSSDDSSSNNNPEPQPETSRWITIAGSKMGETPGDGNGGTVLFAVTKEQAADPNYSVSLFSEEANRGGFGVKSARTARLQSIENGRYIVNVQYGGTDGGQVDKYLVQGQGNYTVTSGANISSQVGSSPRWVKLFDGDKTGVAVNVTAPTANNAGTDAPYEYTVGNATILKFGLQSLAIEGYNQPYQLRLEDKEEEKEGHHIFRLDAPVLNKAADKLLIGTWMRKTDPLTGTVATAGSYSRLGSKTVVVDYPSLQNPKVITSTQGHGDTSGYRSFNSFLADDGAIYQATQRDENGSKILRIGSNNEYDNSYVLSLDDALGVQNSYIDSWRYVGNGIAYALYTHGGNSQGYVARLDLNAKTAEKVDLPYDPAVDFGQYQGFVVDGDNLYITFAPVGKNGNIYIINSKTNQITKGATLVNQAGNNFIGVF